MPPGRTASDAAASAAVVRFLLDALQQAGWTGTVPLPAAAATLAARPFGVTSPGAPPAAACAAPDTPAVAGRRLAPPADAPAAAAAGAALPSSSALLSDPSIDRRPDAFRGVAADDDRGGRAAVAAGRTGSAPARAEAARPAAVVEAAVPDDGAPRPTVAGGLLLLVRVLDRLDYGGWANEHRPDDPGAVACRLYALLLERLGVPRDDPAWQLAGDGRAAPARTSPAAGLPAIGDERCGGSAPDPAVRPAAPGVPAGAFDAAWRGLEQRRAALGGARMLPAPPSGATLPDACAAAWLLLARRWLRRVAGIGPATLVVRPARLALTPTHADVHAGLRAADARIRRAGLDIDPGWVPWLGRVVAFHYDAHDDPPPRPAVAARRAAAGDAPDPTVAATRAP